MNASWNPVPLLVLMATAVFTACSADDPKPATEAELRAVIGKSLGYLARGNDEWMAEKNCNSCHHLPQALWNHREARMRGFVIDEKKFGEWLQWADEKAKNISAGREMVAFMRLAMPAKPVSELNRLIAEGRQPDGSWKPAAQFTAQRRSVAEVTASSSRLFLLALASGGHDKAASDEANVQAAAFLAEDVTASSIETLASRVLFARRFGAPDEVASIAGVIVSLQHADGGWGWQIKESASDSVATGLALYALQPSAAPAVIAAIARAQRWLIKNQKDDGGWPVDYSKISSVDRSTAGKASSLKNATIIYSYWGTAWSTLGLLQGVPVK